MNNFKAGDLFLVKEYHYRDIAFCYIFITKITDKQIFYYHSHGENNHNSASCVVNISVFQNFIVNKMIELVS